MLSPESGPYLAYFHCSFAKVAIAMQMVCMCKPDNLIIMKAWSSSVEIACIIALTHIQFPLHAAK